MQPIRWELKRWALGDVGARKHWDWVIEWGLEGFYQVNMTSRNKSNSIILLLSLFSLLSLSSLLLSWKFYNYCYYNYYCLNNYHIILTLVFIIAAFIIINIVTVMVIITAVVDTVGICIRNIICLFFNFDLSQSLSSI